MTDGGTPARKLTPLWKLLRGLEAYQAAWEAHAGPPAYEEAPFPVRVQSEADLAARDPWRIEAWENPFARDGPASPFLAADEPMLEAEGSARAAPLAAFHAALGGRVDGLRLLDGTLIVKIEQDGRAVQVRVANEGPLLAGGGFRLCHEHGDDVALHMARMAELWSVSGGPAPRPGWVRWARKGSC